MVPKIHCLSPRGVICRGGRGGQQRDADIPDFVFETKNAKIALLSSVTLKVCDFFERMTISYRNVLTGKVHFSISFALETTIMEN